MKTVKKLTNEESIKSAVNLNNYDREIGDYVETKIGEFIIKMVPNLYQPIAERFWLFEQCTDETGEPCMNGEVIKIKLF